MTSTRLLLILACGVVLVSGRPCFAQEGSPDPSAPLSASSFASNAVGSDYSIEIPLTNHFGDAVRGRALVLGRQAGLCILCHHGPFPEAHFQGNLAPDLGESAKRLSAGQLRAHLVAPQRFNPLTIMPSYLRKEGLNLVAAQYQNKSIASEQDIEDMVAFLLTLKN